MGGMAKIEIDTDNIEEHFSKLAGIMEEYKTQNEILSLKEQLEAEKIRTELLQSELKRSELLRENLTSHEIAREMYRISLVKAAVTGLLASYRGHTASEIGHRIKYQLGDLALRAADAVLEAEAEQEKNRSEVIEEPIPNTPEATSDGEPPLDESDKDPPF